jgi:predicted naringenin-chalcone synthase
MLSPSIIFVLSRIRKELDLTKRNPRENKKGYEIAFAFSFAPGVGVEGCLIKIS